MQDHIKNQVGEYSSRDIFSTKIKALPDIFMSKVTTAKDAHGKLPPHTRVHQVSQHTKLNEADII